MPFATLKIPRWSHGLLRSFRVMSMLPAFGPPVATYAGPTRPSDHRLRSIREETRGICRRHQARGHRRPHRGVRIRQAPRIEGVGSCAICETVSLPHNGGVHRAAENDIDFKKRARPRLRVQRIVIRNFASVPIVKDDLTGCDWFMYQHLIVFGIGKVGKFHVVG